MVPAAALFIYVLWFKYFVPMLWVAIYNLAVGTFIKYTNPSLYIPDFIYSWMFPLVFFFSFCLFWEKVSRNSSPSSPVIHSIEQTSLELIQITCLYLTIAQIKGVYNHRPARISLSYASLRVFVNWIVHFGISYDSLSYHI